jgi:hypothetical protein
MATQRQIQHMLRRPSLMARFQLTGQLPRGIRPQSPLIDAIQKIALRDRLRMTGFQIGPSLGYSGSRQFHTVAQALRWLAPDDEVFDSFPAESWRIKNFRQRLTFEDVAKCCASVPEDILARYTHL